MGDIIDLNGLATAVIATCRRRFRLFAEIRFVSIAARTASRLVCVLLSPSKNCGRKIPLAAA